VVLREQKEKERRRRKTEREEEPPVRIGPPDPSFWWVILMLVVFFGSMMLYGAHSKGERCAAIGDIYGPMKEDECNKADTLTQFFLDNPKISCEMNRTVFNGDTTEVCK